MNNATELFGQIFANLKEIFFSRWWVEISTDKPRCRYYFGPFVTKKEASTMQWGYLEDLEGEGAEGIHLSIKRCQPMCLTEYEYEA
ncbi:MAG TPA: DUF1816 domain-containing protein [Stenomitos sp.]